MSHRVRPERKAKLSCVRTTSNIDGTPIQEVLDLFDAKRANRMNKQLGFGPHSAASQDGLAIFINRNSLQTINTMRGVEPRLQEFIFTNLDRPSYIPPNCLNLTILEARQLVRQQGEAGTTWSAVTPDKEGR